jgi:hypothetical protein
LLVVLEVAEQAHAFGDILPLTRPPYHRVAAASPLPSAVWLPFICVICVICGLIVDDVRKAMYIP